MKKKIFIYILAAFMLFSTHAVYGQEEGDYKFDVINGKAEITKYTGNDVNLVIPATLGGYPVRFNSWCN